MRRLALAVLAVAVVTDASANDSTAAFAAGGLVLTATDDIALLEEDLSLSRTEVRVRYVFRNVSAADVTTTVAFPLPDIDLSYFTEVPITQPYPDPDNFVGFTVTVDGSAVTPDIFVSAALGGKDVTATLNEAGVPVSMFSEDFYGRLWSIPRERQDALQAAELAFYERDYDSVYPQWVQHVAFTWTQAFPAGRDVVVEHSYRPVVATTMVSPYTLTSEDEAGFRERYCLDDEAAELDARLAATGESTTLVVDELGYVLTTGANWAGPIGSFRVSVDGGGPDNLIVTCAKPLFDQRPAPGVLAGRHDDFTPSYDLWILIVRDDPES